MSKPSRLPAIAGTLAGLLAAGLGVAWFYPGHIGTAGRAPAPASAPAPSALPAPQAQVRLSRDQAVQQLMALPELKAWAAAIEKNSQGTVRGAVIETDPVPRLVNGKSYFQLSFVENAPQAAVTWQGFLVAPADGEILVQDDASDELLTLERWRRDQRPLQRTGAR